MVMGGVDRLFLLAYDVLSPGMMVALSLAAAAGLVNSFYWLAYRGRMVQRPLGLLAISGAFLGTATFYIVLMASPAGISDITRGASRILWTTLCLSTLYNNSGAALLTAKALAERVQAGHE